MSVVDKPDLRYGFWLGIGLLLAFLAWRIGTALVARARGRANG